MLSGVDSAMKKHAQAAELFINFMIVLPFITVIIRLNRRSASCCASSAAAAQVCHRLGGLDPLTGVKAPPKPEDLQDVVESIAAIWKVLSVSRASECECTLRGGPTNPWQTGPFREPD